MLGAAVITLHHPDDSQQAAEANQAGTPRATLWSVSVRRPFAKPHTSPPRASSPPAVSASPSWWRTPRAKPYPECREPAVVEHLFFGKPACPWSSSGVGPASAVSTHLASVAAGIATAIEAWFQNPLDYPQAAVEAQTQP